MNDSIAFILAISAGLALGALFYGGRWWTTGKAVTSERVALWLLSSLLLRIGLVTTGFYFVGGGRWERFAGCLFGFIAARAVTIALTRRLRQRYGFIPARTRHSGLSQASLHFAHTSELSIDGVSEQMTASPEKVLGQAQAVLDERSTQMS